MKPHETIEDTTEAWEERRLGADEAFVAVAETDDATEEAIDNALGLKMISIRLEQTLIDDFKALATIHGLGYQTLMRQSLKRFADGEKKYLKEQLNAKQPRTKEPAKPPQAKATMQKVA